MTLAGDLIERAVRGVLLVAMFLGGLALWMGVPAAVLWGVGQVVEKQTEHLTLGLLAVPLGMALFAFVLAGLNKLYMRTGEPSPLDSILPLSALIAALSLVAWMLFGDVTTGHGPW